MLGRAKRAREGAAGLAGNHAVIAVSNRGPFSLVAHLKRDTVQVRDGDEASALDPIGRCVNSGNSTEPHVHVHVSNSTDWARSKGVPLAFRRADGNVWLPEDSNSSEPEATRIQGTGTGRLPCHCSRSRSIASRLKVQGLMHVHPAR